jgi:hypothetical protein
VTILLCLLAAGIFSNRHRVWFPGSQTKVLSVIRHEQGLAYIAATSNEDLSGKNQSSPGIVLENGLPLAGPADSLHDDIRTTGKGRYSFWGTEVYFSSSDGTSPQTNGRAYSIRFPTMVPRSIALAAYIAALAAVLVIFAASFPTEATRFAARKVAALYLGPFFALMAALALGCGALLFLGYLGRHGFPEVVQEFAPARWIQPELPYGKTYLARGLYLAGALFGLASLALAFSHRLAIAAPRHLKELATFAGDLIREHCRLLLLATALAAAASLWFRLHPLETPPRDVESIIVAEQLERARSIPETDVLIVGDSSALMGVDASLLGRRLGGMSVENLSTLAWVGPRGYAHLLQMYFRRGLQAKAVVLLMHEAAMNRPSAGWDNWEQVVLTEHAPSNEERNPLLALRTALNSVLFGRVFAPPMPGLWGKFYGSQYEVRSAIRNYHGSLHEPYGETPADSGRWGFLEEPAHGGSISLPDPSFVFRLSPAAELRLREFGNSLSGLPFGRLYFGITPTYLSYKAPFTMTGHREADREADSILKRALDARFTPLDLEPFRPNEYFASYTHLNILGRRYFTSELAATLSSTIHSPAPR